MLALGYNSFNIVRQGYPSHPHRQAYSTPAKQPQQTPFCKPSTPKYEYEMLDIQTGAHAYAQVKNGENNLNAQDFAHLIDATSNSGGKVFLLTTRGKVENCEEYGGKIEAIDPGALYNFAFSKEYENVIPPHIKFWLEFAKKYGPTTK